VDAAIFQQSTGKKLRPHSDITEKVISGLMTCRAQRYEGYEGEKEIILPGFKWVMV
jgi:hypothetical protein